MTVPVKLIAQGPMHHKGISIRKENQSVFNRLDKDKLSSWLEDYTLGDLWEKNVIGGQP